MSYWKQSETQTSTDGSKIEGRVGAALTWWEDGREISSSTFRLDPSCTVFQSELYALLRATKLAESSTEPVVNIMSDSRSSLDLQTLKQATPYSRKHREDEKRGKSDTAVLVKGSCRHVWK
ncbi:unnamed protein product [Parnassius apollo]|uniref:(apollo) hypothetical protein n=1 Tax=Parnassius apollo TaxID=110799 RepID=A0A8S3WYI0_PARAO|nr:unnamed protein product [Parnassius apollo]